MSNHSCLSAAFCCDALHFIRSTPIVTKQYNGRFSLSFTFSHGANCKGATYECFVRESEVFDLYNCPPTMKSKPCRRKQPVTFRNLKPGVWYRCGVKCSRGIVERKITRTFATPAHYGDCCPYFINDGASFAGYGDGNANVTFEWASTGTSSSGFQCRIDFGMSFSCKCVCVCVCVCVHPCEVWICISAVPVYGYSFHAFSGTSPYTTRLSAPDQHVFEVIPQGCTGAYTKTLLKRVEVPAETCVLPYSVN